MYYVIFIIKINFCIITYAYQDVFIYQKFINLHDKINTSNNHFERFSVMKKRDSFNYYDTDEENIFDNESMYYYDDVRDPNNRRRPYNGTMEFTAVRGHNLDRNTRPLGNETMLIGVPPQYQYSNTRLNSFPTAAIPVVQQPLNVVNPQVPNAYYPLEQQPYAFNATPTPVNPY